MFVEPTPAHARGHDRPSTIERRSHVAPAKGRASSARTCKLGERLPLRLSALRAALLAALLMTLVMAGAALAQDGGDAATESDDADAISIARLTVVPDGDQDFDLLTGETTLPDGGTIQDAETGLSLRAAFIRYVEGEYIEAEDARAETSDGELTAPLLRIDVPTLTAVASEGVRYVRDGLEVTAASAELRFEDELVRFDEPRGEDPALEARALLLDVRNGDALLLGPYRFEDGPFMLSDERSDAALQLRPVTTDEGTPTYRAANEVDEDLWTRMAPLR